MAKSSLSLGAKMKTPAIFNEQVPTCHVLLVHVILLEQCEPLQFGIRFGEREHGGIARRDSLHLGVGKFLRADVIGAAGGVLAGDDLGNKPRRGFQGLPHIGVERPLGDVAVDRHLLVFIVVAKNAPVALLNLGGFPRPISTRTELLLTFSKSACFLASDSAPRWRRSARGGFVCVCGELWRMNREVALTDIEASRSKIAEKHEKFRDVLLWSCNPIIHWGLASFRVGLDYFLLTIRCQ